MFADDATFFDKLPSNPWIFLVLAFLTVLSLILAIVFFIRGIKEWCAVLLHQAHQPDP